MRVELSNPQHPEYGTMAVWLPIHREHYQSVMERLATINIGDATTRDCRLNEVAAGLDVLRVLECSNVNIEELDYLAKRLSSFDKYEKDQFQTMASKLDLTDMTDLINLTFCCQQATVITDFSDLEATGRRHYMNLNGGCASTEELDALDGQETALLLLDSGTGTVTPYGVVYDNGMKLEQIYDGKHLPGYHYEPEVLMVGLTHRLEPENTEKITWMYFPAAKGQIERAMLRSGIGDPDNMRFQFEDSLFPAGIQKILDYEWESIYDLNDLALAVSELSREDRVKLEAAATMAEPETAEQIRHLAENLDLFQFAPGAHTPAEYGRYMIQKSGHFVYDSDLEEYYDYEKYGRQHINLECGTFTDRGYISYQGAMSLDELMMEDPAEQHQQEMGGM